MSDKCSSTVMEAIWSGYHIMRPIKAIQCAESKDTTYSSERSLGLIHYLVNQCTRKQAIEDRVHKNFWMYICLYIRMTVKFHFPINIQ